MSPITRIHRFARLSTIAPTPPSLKGQGTLTITRFLASVTMTTKVSLPGPERVAERVAELRTSLDGIRSRVWLAVSYVSSSALTVLELLTGLW